MLRLHTLGPLDLRDDGGREVRSVLQQPKRLGGLYGAGAAPELQDWLDRERLRLRDRAGAAARALADEAERAGRHADAAAYARRAVELSPDDEAALRRYLGLLDRTGERSAA